MQKLGDSGYLPVFVFLLYYSRLVILFMFLNLISYHINGG